MSDDDIKDDPLTMSFDNLLKTDHGLSDDAIKYLTRLNLQMEYNIDSRSEIDTRVSSMDDSLYEVIDDHLKLKKWVQENLAFNPNNPVESSPEYQTKQGFTAPPKIKQVNSPSPPPASSSLQVKGDAQVFFRDPNHRRMFDTALINLRKLNPRIKEIDVFKLLNSTG